MNNPNCDGSGPCNQTLTVRVLPTGGDGNAILCMSCFAREMIFRRERNRELHDEAKFQLPAWSSLKVYAPGGMEAPDLTEFIGETWTLERKAGKVYVTHVGGHTVALNDPAYPSAPNFHVPDYVLRAAKRMLKP